MEPVSIEWYRIPLSKERTRGYTEKSSLRGALQATSVLLLYAATSTAAIVLLRVP